jgi:hypothetical protein
VTPNEKRLYDRIYRQKNKARDMENQRLRRAGVSKEVYRNYLKTHNGLCDICQQAERLKRALCIDHCHKTGKFRGLLCATCNRAIGLLKDSPDLLRRATEYLQCESMDGRAQNF